MEVKEAEIVKTIQKLGISANLLGFQYIKCGVELLLLDDKNRSHGSMTNYIYPTIADKYNSTPSRVERAIRHAIEVCMSRGDTDTINSIFDGAYSPITGKPTNMEFLYTIATRLKYGIA